MPTSEQTQTETEPQTPARIESPLDLTEKIHGQIWNELPRYITQLPPFTDCRVDYYQEYRTIFITPEGLGVDMGHRQNDVNFFQTPSHDIVYADTEVEYIDQRKAKQYDDYAKVSLFRAIWTDLTKQLGELKGDPGP